MTGAQEHDHHHDDAFRDGESRVQPEPVERCAAVETSSNDTQLLEQLEATQDPVVRNAIALALTDRPSPPPEAFPVLVRLLSSQRTATSRGTLLHTLSNYDCSSIVPLLVELFMQGGFEVRREAYNRLMESNADLDDSTWLSLVQRLRGLQRGVEQDSDDGRMTGDLLVALGVTSGPMAGDGES